MEITKEMSIMEIVKNNPETATILGKYGMGCVGCIAARFETLEQGAKAHGMDDKKVDELVKELNSLEK